MSIPRLPFIGITIAALALAIAAGAFALAGALGAGPATAGGGGDDEITTLAEALGVTVEEMEAARRQVMLDRIDAAVESGWLGEERAERLREAVESGEEPGHGRGFRGHHGFGFGWHGGEDSDGAAFAEALGVTVEELEAAMREVVLARIDAAVESGKLSEERADSMREAIESGEPFGREGFERGHRGRGFGFPRGEFGFGFEFDGEMTPEKLLEKIDAAVENGWLSEERAETMREAIESGEPFEFEGEGFGFGHEGFGFEFGSMDIDELRQAMLDRLDAAVEAGMLSEEQAGALRTLIESVDGEDWREFGFGGRGFHRGHR